MSTHLMLLDPRFLLLQPLHFFENLLHSFRILSWLRGLLRQELAILKNHRFSLSFPAQLSAT